MLKQYLHLFLIFFRVGAFTFGGGYAMVPIIEKEVVEKAKLIDENDFLDIIAVAQSLPGPVAVNTSVFVGFKLLGIPGAIFSVLGTALPSLIAIIVLAIFYNQIRHLQTIQFFFQGVRPAVVALILMSALRLSKSLEKSRFNYLLMTATFLSLVFLKIHPIFAILSCAVVGVLYHRKEREDGLS